MIWWASQPGRARAERAAIAELEERSPWLAVEKWGFESDLLKVEFAIRHLDDETRLTLTYPSFFPASVPSVVPKENIRLSSHQWGKGGELCLEIRADNWDPAYTGAMMIQSAYGLLAGERPTDETTAEVPSAHRISQAQHVRGDRWRFLLSEGIETALRALAPGSHVEMEVAEHSHNRHWLVQITHLGPKDAPIWSAETRIADARQRFGFAIRLPEGVPLPSQLTSDLLSLAFKTLGLTEVAEKMIAEKSEVYALFIGYGACRLFWCWDSGDKRTVSAYTRVDLPAPQPRLAAGYEVLAGKNIAIVGGGSMGSKIAISLARSGVSEFVLVDEDILNPDNLVRNDLDGHAIGMHKVDGVAARILSINPAASLTLRRIKLGGQESAGSTDTALVAIGGCDLIIDATADPSVFNLCSAVARSEMKPMVWGEILAGGVGGFVVRARPDHEPPPHAARRQLSAWCDAQGVPWEGWAANRYESEQNDLPPLIADDAEVTVIAGHVTRFALDILLREESEFPHSAYAIGLAQKWIFSGPFDTAPIDFQAEGSWGPEVESDAPGQLKVLVAELLSEIGEASNEA